MQVDDLERQIGRNQGIATATDELLRTLEALKRDVAALQTQEGSRDTQLRASVAQVLSLLALLVQKCRRARATRSSAPPSRRYSACLLYWYKSTNIDAAARRLFRSPRRLLTRRQRS